MGGRAVVSDDEDEMEEVDEEGNMRGAGKGHHEERDDDDDEEDDEEEGQDEYEKDGFIVDDVDEEEGEENNEDSDEERHRRKKRKRRESERTYVLDEDDYELLEDNNITVHRPKPGSKFKRLKKAGRDSEMEEHSGFSDDEESERADRGGRTAEEKLKRSLFGDDEGAPLEDIAEEEEQPEEEDGDLIGDEDEMADFIVDEEGTGFSDDEESERVDRGGRTVEEKLKRSLFGDNEALDDIAKEEEQPEEDGDLIGDEDEMVDFIVDEEDDENGTNGCLPPNEDWIRWRESMEMRLGELQQENQKRYASTARQRSCDALIEQRYLARAFSASEILGGERVLAALWAFFDVLFLFFLYFL